jgi:hypothetical protein
MEIANSVEPVQDGCIHRAASRDFSSTTLSLLNTIGASNIDQRIKNPGRKLFSSPGSSTGNCRRLRVLRSRLNDEERDMPRPVSSKPFASVIYLFPTLVHCPTCDVLQPMHINGVQPALYCGKDMVFYQCTKCGNETEKRVATHGGPAEGSQSNGSP